MLGSLGPGLGGEDGITRDINGENEPSPKTFIFGGFRENDDPGDRLQGFWITPKTKKVTAILKIRIFTTSSYIS